MRRKKCHLNDQQATAVNEVIGHLIKFLYWARFPAINSAVFRSRFGSNTLNCKSYSIMLSQLLGSIPQGLLLAGTQFFTSFSDFFISIRLTCP